jgi:hypothetical protein
MLPCYFFTVCENSRGCGISCAGDTILKVATAEVGADGTFKIELPDFGADPIASPVSNTEFVFSLKDISLAPGHINYRQIALEPESNDFRSQTGLGGLRIAESYPSGLIFVARTKVVVTSRLH